MNPTKPSRIIRLFAATLITVATISLSALAMHAPTQTQSPLTLKSVQTDRAVTLYANHRPSCAWFVEMVLPTGDGKLADRRPSCAWFVEMVLPTGDGKLADRRPSCAWFVEMVLPTGDSELMTENLQSVAATL